ncbi:MAG: hypothetical protein AAB364_03250 [Patescibacteria group bacterium]|mgnify:CR=1 FL=1
MNAPAVVEKSVHVHIGQLIIGGRDDLVFGKLAMIDVRSNAFIEPSPTLRQRKAKVFSIGHDGKLTPVAIPRDGRIRMAASQVFKVMPMDGRSTVFIGRTGVATELGTKFIFPDEWPPYPN